MDKRIEDYLHLYLGCQYRWMNKNGSMGGNSRTLSPTAILRFYNKEINIIPVLRKLEDITEEEQAEADRIHDDDNNRSPMGAQLPFYLLLKYFDLFGLIPAGLAIDKTKMNTNG